MLLKELKKYWRLNSTYFDKPKVFEMLCNNIKSLEEQHSDYVCNNYAYELTKQDLQDSYKFKSKIIKEMPELAI